MSRFAAVPLDGATSSWPHACRDEQVDGPQFTQHCSWPPVGHPPWAGLFLARPRAIAQPRLSLYEASEHFTSGRCGESFFLFLSILFSLLLSRFLSF